MTLASLGQIAVIGGSGDLATAEELAAASALGRLLAERRLICIVAGDDGVMGAAARGSKNAGGTTIAVLSREKLIQEPGLFDAVVDTGLAWVQFGDALIRSCRAAIIVGGGAGTMGELAMLYIAGTPAAFLGGSSELAIRFGGEPLDARDLARFPVFERPEAALADVLERSGDSPIRHMAAGSHLHLSSYPFDKDDAYMESAVHFRAAAARNPSAVARYEDAVGDHFYYKVSDYLRAASHFAAARRALGGHEPALAAYLTAIALESTAMGLNEVGEHAVAAKVSARAAEAYIEALDVSPSAEHHLLRHSAAGASGDAALFEGLAARRVGHLARARDLLAHAKDAYQEACAHHPPYGDRVSSSSLDRALAAVEVAQHELDHADNEASP